MGLYISSKLDDASNTKLKKFVAKLPLEHKIKEEYYHCTLIYDKSADEATYKPSKAIQGAEAFPLFWDVFGEEQPVLVLRLQSPDLEERQKELLSAGFKMSYDKYNPHITVAVVTKDFDVSVLPIPTFNLKFSHEYAKPLDDKFKYDPKSMCEGQLATFRQQLLNETMYR